MTIEELARLAGVPVRTVRFYIAEGLLPGPRGRGKRATYGEEHRLRLRLIRQLVDQRVPLAEIRARLAGLSLADVRAVLAEAEDQSREMARAAEVSPHAYVSTLLKRARQAREPRLGAPAAMGDMALPAMAPPAAAPATPEAWTRWELAPGVELQVRADAEPRQRALIDRLLAAAGLSPEDSSRRGRPRRGEASDAE